MFKALIRRAAVGAIGIAAAVIMSSQASFAQSEETVRLLTARPGWQMISPWWATDLGLWQKHGVEVEHIPLGSSAAVMEAFVSGQGDMAIVNIGTVVNAYFRGVPLRIVGSVPGSDYPVISMAPEIDGLDDVEGKTVAVWSIPNDATLAFDAAMAERGIASGTGFTYVQVPMPNICQTLQQGQVDVAIMFEPYASACMLEDANRIAPPGTVSFMPPKISSSSVVIANAAFLEENRDAVRRALAAIYETAEWAAENKEDASGLLSKYSGEEMDAVSLSYDNVNFDLTIDREYHGALLSKYVDTGLIDRAPTEEELQELYVTDLLQGE